MELSDLLEEFNVVINTPEGLTELRSLILGLAVRGKLVPQDPNDEPASELLKKIKAEKERLYEESVIRKPKTVKPIKQEEIPYKLPKGWGWVRLGAISNYGNHDSVLPGDISEDTWVLELADIEKDTSRIIEFDTYQNRKSKSNKYRFQEGDVLYGKLRPYLNKVVIAPNEGVCSTEIIPLKCLSGLVNKYLLYALKRDDFLNYANSVTYGTKMPRLGTKDGRRALIPLPPAIQQQRIVQKIESLFAEVDELEEKLNRQTKLDEKLQLAVNADVQQAPDTEASKSAWTFITSNFDTLYHTPKAIDNLKKNILNEAVRGRLVPQNPNDEPSSELLKKIEAKKERLYDEGETRKPKKLPPIKEDEIPFEIPESWEWCRLGNVILETDAGKSPSCEKRPVSEDEWGVLTTTAIQENEFLEKENKVLPEKFEVQEQHIVHKDDVLITRAGPLNRTGILCHVEQVNFKLILSDKTIRLNHHLDYTYPRYTPFALNSSSMRPILESYMTGMAKSQVNISQTNIKKLIFPLPPLEEQHRIVQRIEELFAICDRFKTQLEQREKVNKRVVKGLVGEVLEEVN